MYFSTSEVLPQSALSDDISEWPREIVEDGKRLVVAINAMLDHLARCDSSYALPPMTLEVLCSRCVAHSEISGEPGSVVVTYHYTHLLRDHLAQYAEALQLEEEKIHAASASKNDSSLPRLPAIFNLKECTLTFKRSKKKLFLDKQMPDVAALLIMLKGGMRILLTQKIPSETGKGWKISSAVRKAERHGLRYLLKTSHGKVEASESLEFWPASRI